MIIPICNPALSGQCPQKSDDEYVARLLLNLSKSNNTKMKNTNEETMNVSTKENVEVCNAAESMYVSQDPSGRCKCGKRITADHPPCKSEIVRLCEEFLSMIADIELEGKSPKISLSECVQTLGVPRRRIYDIAIIYEAVEVLKRVGSQEYQWCGLSRLPEVVASLQSDKEPQASLTDGRVSPGAAHARGKTLPLWKLTRLFMRILVLAQKPVHLTEAAKIIINSLSKSKRTEQTQMTVERRLYDIASILSTLNLVKKMYRADIRQPFFKWTYPSNLTKNGLSNTTVSEPTADVPDNTSYNVSMESIVSEDTAISVLCSDAERRQSSDTECNIISSSNVESPTSKKRVLDTSPQLIMVNKKQKIVALGEVVQPAPKVTSSAFKAYIPSESEVCQHNLHQCLNLLGQCAKLVNTIPPKTIEVSSSLAFICQLTYACLLHNASLHSEQ